MTPRRLLLLNVALVVWLLVVQIAYYGVHKPVVPGAAAGWAVTRDLLARPWQPVALLQPLGDLTAVLLLLALGWLVGRALLRVLPFTTDQEWLPVEHSIVAVALGLGGLSLITLGLTAAGWFSLVVALSFGGVGAAALLGAEGYAAWKTGGSLQLPFSRGGRTNAGPSLAPVQGTDRAAQGSRRYPHTLRRARRPAPATVPAISTEGELGPLVAAFLWGYLALTLALALLRALTPPVAWDSLVYHLTGPRLWVESGRMVGGIDLPHYYFPPLVELLYALLVLVRGDTAAQALHVMVAALTVAATGMTARRFLGPGYGLPAAALLLSGASLVSLAERAYVEWGVLLFVVLAVWALGRWQGERGGWLALAGVFLGLALAVKYTAVAVVLGVVLFVAGSTVAARLPRRILVARLAVLGGVAGLVAAPWYLRSLLLTGNPVYPFVFGGWNWDAWKAAWFSRPGTGLVLEPWRILLAPWELTVLGIEGGLPYDGAIGPMFLILLPLLAFLPRPPFLRLCLTVAGVAYAFWLFGATASSLLQQPRLLYPIFPLLSLLGAWALLGARAWAVPALRPQRLLVAALLLGLSLGGLSHVVRFAVDTPLAYFVGAESRAEYLTRHLGSYYPLVSQLGARAGPEVKVLFLWEPRTYYCMVSCQPDGLLLNWRYALHRHGNAAAIRKAWEDAGYTHVLLHGAGLRYFLSAPSPELDAGHVQALQTMEARYLERLEGPDVATAVAGEGGRYTLYRIRREP